MPRNKAAGIAAQRSTDFHPGQAPKRSLAEIFRVAMTVSLEQRGPIGILWIDNPPVNAITHAVREGMSGALDAAAGVGLDALVIACRGRTFMAGADIAEFARPIEEPTLAQVIRRLDAMTIPTVAAIHGTALGGGLEVALACHYRVADGRATVGLPEVKIGLVPGAGGTQRLPRLAGVSFALEAITSGESIAAQTAREHGIVDRIVDDDVVAATVDFAREIVARGAPLRRTSDLEIRAFDADVFDDVRRRMAKARRGFVTPQLCIDAVEAAARLPFDEGLARERELSHQSRASTEGKALRHLFFAERRAGKSAGASAVPRDIADVGVIGCGTMGSGIVMACLNAGLKVTLIEATTSALERGVSRIRGTYSASVERKRLSAGDAEARMRALSASLCYQALAGADLVIEAVFEDMEIKRDVFRKADEVAKPGALLATNTSYLDVDEIAAATARPGDVLGLHFFSPANVMKLLEIVRASKTSPETLATALAFARRIGKIGVVAGVCRGFIGNRMLQAYQREAGLVVLEGACPREVDTALYGFGMAMGPFAVADLAGLDVGHMARQALDPAEYETRAFAIADRLVAQGRYGQKTGGGWYRYEHGDRTPQADPAVDAIIAKVREELKSTRRVIEAREIVERCIYALVNEGAQVLADGIANRASDIDVVYVNGYGFPRYRGGPMHFAEAVGLDKVLERVRDFQTSLGARWWTPAPLLERAARSGRWPATEGSKSVIASD